ncbi:MAG: DUF4956 domain-containing protein [Kiritimatiellae bacterium]|nr:DUF4956 domain-containing protein [Kiritimatiellia bacterium]
MQNIMANTSLIEAAKLVLFGGESERIADVGLAALSVALAGSLGSSLIWSLAYSRFYSHRGTGSNIHRCFPLLAIAVTAIFICVQFSLPLSLGLLGSLSIVRFRTPIKEPEEIGFILLVIATSLCCASFNGVFLLSILGCGLGALLLMRWNPKFLAKGSAGGTLVLRGDSASCERALEAVCHLIKAHLDGPVLESLTTQDSESVYTWSFRKAAFPSIARLESELRGEVPGAAIGIYISGNTDE